MDVLAEEQDGQEETEDEEEIDFNGSTAVTVCLGDDEAGEEQTAYEGGYLWNIMGMYCRCCGDRPGCSRGSAGR